MRARGWSTQHARSSHRAADEILYGMYVYKFSVRARGIWYHTRARAPLAASARNISLMVRAAVCTLFLLINHTIHRTLRKSAVTIWYIINNIAYIYWAMRRFVSKLCLKLYICAKARFLFFASLTSSSSILSCVYAEFAAIWCTPPRSQINIML